MELFMASRDRYSRKLVCSRCENEGFADVSELDDKTGKHVDFRMEELPRGFRVEREAARPEDFMIRCAQCANVFRFAAKSYYASGGEPVERS